MLHGSRMMNYKSKIINHWDLQARHNLRLFLTSRSSSIILFQNDLNTVAILLLYLYAHTYCKLVHFNVYQDNCHVVARSLQFQKTGHIPIHSFNLYRKQVRSLPCLSLSQSLLLLNFAQIFEFIKVVRWISLSSYMDLTKLMHGILYFVTWTWQFCYMDL